MPFIIPANTLASGSYDVDNSLRLDGAAAYLNRTPSSASNRRTFTFSTWIKRSGIDGSSVHQDIFSSDAGDDESYIHFVSDNLKIFSTLPSGTGAGDPACVLITTQKFRDFSAWYHIVVAVDTTQGTAANRAKLYINGTQVTSFSTETYPDQNYQFATNAAVAHMIGRRPAGGKFLPAYLAETVLIDGSQLAPTDFGEFDEDSGIWKPIDVSGLTFGTNGFYLNYQSSGDLGASTNSSNYTSNSLAAIDQATDTCTNNFCTMNPLSSGMTLTEGNTNVAGAATAKSTFGVASGKWYVEMKATNAQTYNPIVGIATASSLNSGNPASSDHPGSFVESHGYDRSGVIKSNDNTAVQSGLTTSQSDGDIIGLAIDLDSGTKTAQWYVNGSSVGSAVTLVSNDAYVFMTYASGSQAGTGAWNFGNPSFTGTDKADGNGFGSFEYQPPSGFLALCTKNLAESG